MYHAGLFKMNLLGCQDRMDSCPVANVQRRSQTYSNGVVVHVMQCVNCGKYTGSGIRKDGSNPPPLDKNLMAAGREAKYANYEAAKMALEPAAGQQYCEQDYAAYLKSEAWRAKRRKVIERDGICQGCRNAPIDDVHHLSYRNMFDEFLFQLVGLCRDCHERWHQK